MGGHRFLPFLLVVGLTAPLGAEPIPLAIKEGRCTFIVRADRAQAFNLVVGAAQPSSRPFRLTLSASATTAESALPRMTIGLAAAHVAKLPRRPVANDAAAAGSVPALKVFHLLTRADEIDSATSYHAVTAKFHAAGRTVQVYVDREEKLTPDLEKTVAEILRVMDDEIVPWTTEHLGRVADIDRDGRFTILLTPRVGQMPVTPALQGFVRSSDFFRDMPTPFSNRADMLYLDSGLKAGPHLRTLLAHEFAHAIVFCEHYLERHESQNRWPRDEDGWLNEGIAHVVESRLAYSWSNLDHRIAAYLANPERYRLVVEDYFSEKLWRDPGTRGATFLFLDWCQQRQGNDLLTRLARTNRHGIDNLEHATGERFDELFRAWTVSQVTAPWQPRASGPKFGPQLTGPRRHAVKLDEGRFQGTLAGTAACYFRLECPRPGSYEVQIDMDADAKMQVTLIVP